MLIYFQPKLLWKCDGKQLQAVFQCALSAATPLPTAYDCVAVYIAGACVRVRVCVKSDIYESDVPKLAQHRF